MADRQSERDHLAEARHLHRPRIEEGVARSCAEGECEHEQCHNGDELMTSDFKVCAHCVELADLSGLLDEFWPNWVLWPCKTAEALYDQPRFILPSEIPTPPGEAAQLRGTTP
jgi:hypothetical protein